VEPESPPVHLVGSFLFILHPEYLYIFGAQTSTMAIIDTGLSINSKKCLSATIVQCALASTIAK
jgi:hypothetical protein